MKKLILVLFLITINYSFGNSQNYNNEELVNLFFEGMNQHDFEMVKASTSNKFIITEGDEVLCTSRDEFYELFAWDSVFNPSFEIVELTMNENYIRATISKSCTRIRFLHDLPLVYNVDILIEDEQIKEMRTRDYLNADFGKWTLRRDMLKVWTQEKHPEIPGFINIMSIDGAMNYVKAIELYQEDNSH